MFYNNSGIIFECFVSLKGGFVKGKNFEGGFQVVVDDATYGADKSTPL